MTDYNDGKWHGWNGGECPVHPDSVVMVTYGRERDVKEAHIFDWDHESVPIIAFRVTKQHKEPREFWLYKRGSNFSYFVSNSPVSSATWASVIHVREVME